MRSITMPPKSITKKPVPAPILVTAPPPAAPPVPKYAVGTKVWIRVDATNCRSTLEFEQQTLSAAIVLGTQVYYGYTSLQDSYDPHLTVLFTAEEKEKDVTDDINVALRIIVEDQLAKAAKK